jgi:uncharacterized protein involved in high-affinity Fe2+ transport
VTSLILLGVGLILLFNLNPSGTIRPQSQPKPDVVTPLPTPPGKLGGKECPIGDEVLKNHMRIAAVWLPAIQMAGMEGQGASDVIHIEADIHATEGNPNGFARDEFVPYLKIAYKIVPTGGGAPVDHGEMMPMVAADGLHYGASIVMPKRGSYKLIYEIKPPSAGGLGRHSDPATGVAPWWEPFEASFLWDDCPGPEGVSTENGIRLTRPGLAIRLD